MLDTPSLETQANFIRIVYQRKRPDEIRRMNEALDHPDLDPKVKELILKIREEVRVADKKPLSPDEDDAAFGEWSKGGRRIPPRPNLSLIDGDTDAPGYSEDPDK